MHLFTSHRPEARRYFAYFDLPTHPICWLRGHRAKAEAIDYASGCTSWVLITCRTCGIRHSDPYLTQGAKTERSRDERDEIVARQVEAARNNNAAYAAVRDGRDGYGHHRLELSLEVTRRGFRKSGVHLHVGDRWSETPFDGSVHAFGWSAYYSIGGVGNRLAHWLTKGKKGDVRIGAGYVTEAP